MLSLDVASGLAAHAALQSVPPPYFRCIAGLKKREEKKRTKRKDEEKTKKKEQKTENKEKGTEKNEKKQ